MITPRVWVRLMLLLPFIIPALLFGVGWLAYKAMGVQDFGALDFIMSFLAIGAVYAGVQYTVFTLLILWWYWDRDVKAWVRLCWVLPFLFVPLCGLGWFIYDPKPGVFVGALFAIPIGYFYIVLAWLLTGMASMFKLIAWEAQAEPAAV